MDTVIIKSSKHGAIKRRSVGKSIKAGLMLATALVLQLASTLANAVALTDIAFSSLPGGKVEIRLSFDGTPPQPKGYAIEKPAENSLGGKVLSTSVAAKTHCGW